jgi:hypothetical protein
VLEPAGDKKTGGARVARDVADDPSMLFGASKSTKTMEVRNGMS